MADAHDLFRRMIEEGDDAKRADLRAKYVAEVRRVSQQAVLDVLRKRRRRRRWPIALTKKR